MSVKSFLTAWDKFFFEPKPTEGIALFRIVWSCLLAVYFLFDISNITDFYGPHAILSLKTAKDQFPYIHANIFHFFTSNYEVVKILFLVYGIAILCSMFGLYTRTSLFVVLICMTSLHQRNIWLLSSSELLLRLITLYLVLSPCGHSLSVDSLLGRKFVAFRRERDWAPWAQRLIQIQISVVYLWTVWHKLKGEDWIDGTAVYYATRIESMKNVSLFLLDNVLFLKMMTWATLAIEVGLGILLWTKKFRRPMIMIGILFHLGIELTMSIPFFEWVMVCLLTTFITPKEVRVISRKLFRRMSQEIERSTVYPDLKSKLVWMMRGHYAKS